MRRTVAFGFGAAVLSVVSVAWAWSQGAEITATVHGHAFTRVVVESADCVLHYRIYFDAPQDAYASAARTRNVYLFRARIDFASGKAATAPVFANRAPGARMYENRYDSAGDGCWVKDQQALRRLEVEGCRGDGCTPEFFH
ncbi:MAG TPA: hypothetical protein VMI54_07695 [Polyangiaceae bacterium]|nr:hypothetical protein [Polyangiaceae bacterium]